MEHEVLIKCPEINLDKKLNIIDIRQKSHSEWNGWDNLHNCIDEAISTLGFNFYPQNYLERITSIPNKKNELSKFTNFLKIMGNIVGVIKYTRKHGHSTLSRYINEYEGINILSSKQMLKIDGKIVWGINSWPRIELLNHIDSLCQDISEPRILEAGCGAGLNMFMLTRKRPEYKIDGFEFTHARLATSIINLIFEKNIGKLFLGDITKIDLPDNSYDLVFTNHVIEQLGQQNAAMAIKEVLRVSRKSVVLVEPTLYKATMYEKWRLKRLGYCEDLLSIAKSLPNCKIKVFKEDDVRNYPNTSNTLILEKIS